MLPGRLEESCAERAPERELWSEDERLDWSWLWSEEVMEEERSEVLRTPPLCTDESELEMTPGSSALSELDRLVLSRLGRLAESAWLIEELSALESTVG